MQHAPLLVLPLLPKFCELSERREHFHWARAVVLRLLDAVPPENAVGHQAIAYCACRCTAVLNLPLAELQPVVQLAQGYLRSSHRFVRNATLRGLLGLLDSYAASNTAIGRLSDELALVRQLVVAYVTRYVSAKATAATTTPAVSVTAAPSDEHTRLVWSLTWFVVETTSKFCPECTVLADAVLAAGTVLRQMANADLQLAILGVSNIP